MEPRSVNVIITKAQGLEDLKGIWTLQDQNHKNNVREDQRMQTGFVTVRHTLDLLSDLNNAAPQIVAKEGNRVVGYALMMPVSFRKAIPVLEPMFDMLDGLSFQGQSLRYTPYYVMGQVCVDAGYRRRGILGQLYEGHRNTFSSEYQYCITEVSDSNLPSMKAHIKTGFQVIHTFNDQTDHWNILLWDWT